MLELCKIGLLFLNDGQWEGSQIITPDWIEKSQYKHVPSTANFFPNSGYGYYWWLTNFTVKGVSHKPVPQKEPWVYSVSKEEILKIDTDKWKDQVCMAFA